ncbi:MAG: bifunctional diaminohydroxyphosphoribosylaminopyrimidine deaminase/5-amino-6-(5-phosphoribosylamino)uracil reductase RibD [Alphaproteobacteria bacterium]
MVSTQDTQYIKSAIAMARRGIGRTGENPSVGCIIVKGGHIIARAHTSDNGRPHAEVNALQQAGEKARNATLYVTLEPCTHHGKTPPCIDAIIAAGIKRVVIGSMDIDPRVDGKSVKLLQNAGVEVLTGILTNECDLLNIGFFTRLTKERPYITLKTACTLDGKIATSSGQSKWITGGQAREHVHQLRSRHDAILVGIDTVLADNPALTTRVTGVEHKTARIILDSDLRTPISSDLVQTAKDMPLHIFYTKTSDHYDPLINAGAILHEVPKYDLNAVLKVLANSGINRVLVEGGATVHTEFLKQKLCDELHVYRAPTCIGEDGVPVVKGMSIDSLSKRLDFQCITRRSLGHDCLEIYKKKGQR